MVKLQSPDCHRGTSSHISKFAFLQWLRKMPEFNLLINMAVPIDDSLDLPFSCQFFDQKLHLYFPMAEY